MAFPTATAFTNNSAANVTTSPVVHGGATGERIVVLFEKDGTAAPTGGTTGWNLIASGTQGSAMWTGVYYRDLDGGANDTLSITHASEGSAWYGIRVGAGTYDTGTAPAISANVGETSTTPSPGLCSPPWGTSDTLWIALCGWDGNVAPGATPYPSNCADNRNNSRWANTNGGGAIGATSNSATLTFDAADFTLGGSSSNLSWTVGVRPATVVPEAPMPYFGGGYYG